MYIPTVYLNFEVKDQTRSTLHLCTNLMCARLSKDIYSLGIQITHAFSQNYTQVSPNLSKTSACIFVQTILLSDNRRSNALPNMKA